MKMPKNINHKLSGVPIENRVFVYDASIIIEFLNRTFMPLSYHLTREAMLEVGAGKTVKPGHLKDPKRYDDLFISVGDIYEYYKLYRDQMPYTAPVETRWKFGLIIKKMILTKNGWQFNVKRVGRAQIWYAGPIELRAKVPLDIRKNFPIGPANVSAGQVEMKPEDMQEQPVQLPDDPTLT